MNHKLIGRHEIVASEGLSSALTASTDTGDEALVAEPFQTNDATFAPMVSVRLAPPHTTMKVAARTAILFFALLAPAAAQAESVAPPRPHPFAHGGANLVTYAGIQTDLEGQGTSADAALLKYEWDFDGDGHYDWVSRQSCHAHASPSSASPWPSC